LVEEKAMRKRLLGLGVLVVLSMAQFLPAIAAETSKARAILSRIGVTRGICVLLGDKGCELALGLARNSELTLFVQLASAEDVAAASRAADAAGLYGTRIVVAKGSPARIGLADNVADALVAAAPRGVPKAEALRVLRPEGKALLGQKELIKPFPKGTDDWSHHYHGPDNNTQSRDRLARAPYMTQFIAEPRYGPAPQAAVASGGRIFMAFGHVAWHQREEPCLDTLIAMNGYNGTILWKRPLRSGIVVDRSTMIATPTTLYLADQKSCKLIDPATGKVRDEIVAPVKLTGGTFWKWMALDDGVLYALIGEAEGQDRVARWRRTGHGWPWGGISDGYNKGPYRWGFSSTLLAISPKTKRVLWRHREGEPIDSRGLCVKSGRIYICSFGKYVACLNAKTGREIWRRTAQKDPDIFRAIGPYRPGHGYVGGWKSTVYLKCTDRALYFVGPQVNWLTALSAEDGRFLWKYPARDLHIVIRDDGLYTIGCQGSKGHTNKLDPLTGKVLASYQTHRRACTRSTGSVDSILFRASGGSARFDPAAGKVQWISAMRPSCHVGVVVANGHLYWLPWTCDCNLQMFGVICLGPAGEFQFDQKATAQQRLDKVAAEPTKVAAFGASAADWPTYRANNARTARTQAAIPDKVVRLWAFAGKAEPTAPVAVGGMAFLSGSDGIVRAFDAATGEPRWTAYAGGSVRFPPTIANGRALVGSDDGYAHAFEAATGRLLWRFRAAPAERRIPVYGRLLSTWPVASGVLVESGTAYLAAGINDFDGTHVYALDPATGAIKWQNNTSGHLDAWSRRGVACQGEMLLHNGRLYLAGGNAVSPGVFDIRNGQCLSRPPTSMGTRARRGRELRLAGGKVSVCGQPLHSLPEYPVYSGEVRWENPVVAAKNARLFCRRGKGAKGPTWQLVAQRDGRDLWQQPLPAEPVRWGMAVDAQGRTIVTLRNGQVLCFGKKPG